jgi:hypothetical protein
LVLGGTVNEELGVYDLMYCEESETYKEVSDTILKQYPDAVLEDGSDDVHSYRLVVKLDKTHKRDWLKFLMKKGIHNFSFIFSIMSLDGDEVKILRPIMEAVVAEGQDI